jgi:hypothetical protein
LSIPELADNHSPFDDDEEDNFVDQVVIFTDAFIVMQMNPIRVP